MTPTLPPPPAQLMQVALSKMLCRPLALTAKLGIADYLVAGPRHVSELAKATRTDESALYRVLRTLAGFGFFVELDERRFDNSPTSRLLARGPGSMRAAVLMMDAPWHHAAWDHLEHSVRTGQPGFDKAHGSPVFAWAENNPEAAQLFNECMTALTANNHRAAARAYDFSGIRTLVDIGGGHGELMFSILDAHSHISGTVFDQPSVIRGTQGRIAERTYGPRCEAVGGDFFKEVPLGADAYIMAHIIHDWDDHACKTILGLCARAMAPGGRVLVVEGLMPEPNKPDPVRLIDIEMLVMTNGGRERTEHEFAQLFSSAGLRLNKVVPTEAHQVVLEAVRA